MSPRQLTPSRIRRRVLLRRAWFRLFVASGNFFLPFFLGCVFSLAMLQKPLIMAVNAADQSYAQLLKVCKR